jgi:hypothetical protein
LASLIAISSSAALVAVAPAGAFFAFVPVADPIAAALLSGAFVSVPVAARVAVVPLAAIFVSVLVAARVLAALVSAAQVPFPDSIDFFGPSYFPGRIFSRHNELLILLYNSPAPNVHFFILQAIIITR